MYIKMLQGLSTSFTLAWGGRLRFRGHDSSVHFSNYSCSSYYGHKRKRKRSEEATERILQRLTYPHANVLE